MNKFVLLALTLFTCSFALAHESSHAVDEDRIELGRVLGKLSFPTSTQSAEAQAAFDQGMLLLHLFEYSFAEAEFQRAQALDPDFAMAYWGEAVLSQPEPVPFNLLYLDRLGVIEQQIQAALAIANGDGDAALEYAREASRLEGQMPFSFGPPFVDYPSAQQLGELAFDLGNYEEAVSAFSEQLKPARKKTQAVEGLARAERKALSRAPNVM